MPSGGKGAPWTKIDGLYRGSLGIVAIPRGGEFARALGGWTAVAQRCRPAPRVQASPGDPIPARPGGATPIRYVVYVIKENRTYDQVFGDLPQGNGDPSICLFPERVTPNIHAIARQFVLLDNFYANAEVSAGGHEWSMAGYSSEFVEKSWPVNYGREKAGTHVPYPGEGHYAAAVPALGYLWDRARAAGVTYRSYGEFTVNPGKPGGPVETNMPALKGHVDPAYRGWDLKYHDRDRAGEFIAELRRYEAAGDMPRLQIVRLPQDHTAGAKLGDGRPVAMVADNDLAVGRVVEALSRSRFWARTAVFIVEDDAQSGPDHVDAHRTEALVAGPFVRRGAVDSTPYTTCSMLRTIELILGLEPMSQFDAEAAPMRASFQPEPDLSPFSALAAGVDIEARNVRNGPSAADLVPVRPLAGGRRRRADVQPGDLGGGAGRGRADAGPGPCRVRPQASRAGQGRLTPSVVVAGLERDGVDPLLAAERDVDDRVLGGSQEGERRLELLGALGRGGGERGRAQHGGLERDQVASRRRCRRSR